MTKHNSTHGVTGLRAALDEAARALFAIKRMKPEAVPEFAAEAHRKACVVLDAAGVMGTLNDQPKGGA